MQREEDEDLREEQVVEEETPEQDGADEADNEQAKLDEAEARRHGWVPEAEWDDELAEKKGIRKPAKFKGAREFLDAAYSNPAMLRERFRRSEEHNRELLATNRELLGKVDGMAKVFQDQRKLSQQAQERAYQKGIEDAKAKRAEAIKDGDLEAADKAQEELEELKEKVAEIKTAAEPDDGDGDERPAKRNGEDRKAKIDPGIQAWVDKTTWFNQDPVRKAYMIDEHARLKRENPGVSEVDLLEDAEREVRKRFPERFGDNPRRKGPPTVSRPTGERQAPNGGGRGKTWNDVPKADQEVFERHKKMIEGAGGKYTREDFLKDYQF